MKLKRHQAILDTILQEPIYTQEGLLAKLNHMGFHTTQATISRDIKELNLIKSLLPNGRYAYTQKQDERNLPPNSKDNNIAVKFYAIFTEAVISIDYAINTVVLKCHVGMANAACAALDHMELNHIVGTLAGDDTIFILMRTENDAHRLVETIQSILMDR